MDEVRQRTSDLYGEGMVPMIPAAVKAAAETASRVNVPGGSLIWEKNATPPEPPQCTATFERSTRPCEIATGRSGLSEANTHEGYIESFSKFGKLTAYQGSVMTKQFEPGYFQAAFPFSFPAPVGGFDLRGKDRPSRPTDKDMANVDVSRGNEFRDLHLPGWYDKQKQVSAARVSMLEWVRGTSRSCFSQFRRHWDVIPAAWNLYFRSELNLGKSMHLSVRGAASTPSTDECETVAAAAMSLWKKLQGNAFWVDSQGMRKPLRGDVQKLPFAEGITPLERKLLADVAFRSSMLPGTAQVRKKMGRLMLWTSVVYGNCIFFTISPGERHNVLAVRLSRYRRHDPCTAGMSEEELRCIGPDHPSLEADVEFELPAYGRRREMLTKDPLCAVYAFKVYCRVVLAALLGVRMCMNCPHCSASAQPCMDAFGSNAEAAGGAFGRVDAVLGASECQRAGPLHLHGFAFAQRLHQHHTLLQIAQKIKEGYCDITAFKEYYRNICREDYPDIDAVEEHRDRVEKRFPMYADNPRLGRLHLFVRRDAQRGPDFSLAADQDGAQELRQDGLAWLEQHDAALTEVLLHHQNHIHFKDSKGQKTVLPNACTSQRQPNACKHGFPQSARMNEGETLLLCAALCKQRGIKNSGKRKHEGTFLGSRNDPWLASTCPAFALGLCGGNTDVTPNDRIPVMRETHEASCQDRCVSRGNLREMSHGAQVAQSRMQGYTGGYALGKVPQVKPPEIKRILQKLARLEETTSSASVNEQFRAFSGRMVSDIECNGVVRPATMVYQLCDGLRENDVLNAECLRTFDSQTVDMRSLLNRFRVEQAGSPAELATTFLPATRTPKVAAASKAPPLMDIYGFRPAPGSAHPWANEWWPLSFFEFVRDWTAEALVHPRHPQSNGRTAWTALGVDEWERHKRLPTELDLRPGIHYHVVEDEKESARPYYTFPERPEEVFGKFRHSWVIVRRQRPVVPMPEGVPLPPQRRSPEENTMYLSLLFRPWTLHGAFHSRDVVHLSLLDVPAAPLPAESQRGDTGPVALKRRRLRRKTSLLWFRAPLAAPDVPACSSPATLAPPIGEQRSCRAPSATLTETTPHPQQSGGMAGERKKRPASSAQKQGLVETKKAGFCRGLEVVPSSEQICRAKARLPLHIQGACDKHASVRRPL